MSFLNTSHFPFLSTLEDHWKEIRSEYDAMAAQSIPWHEAIHNGKWDVIGFRFQGHDILENQRHAPITTSICDQIPGIFSYGFSIMKPGCEIKPHVGYTDAVLRAHLGLYSNPHAALQVGEEVCTWTPGKIFVFDDTTLHSAWNRGDSIRVILLFDFFRPVEEEEFSNNGNGSATEELSQK
ncbi:MAG: aspartyl/asparaginyl beta-hydroxylase domain-containing protein [Verrucomicrobia bacterium]|nr:MAG: aspartyl/asparaginyl beta-hydroxylase domain-containing protein [Verrucomicrobiota bacterium]MDH4470857.1 aspartyl/asparaginyl beta-hydroxylase domain-containing protein [Verrucomicrobiae bacterium]